MVSKFYSENTFIIEVPYNRVKMGILVDANASNNIIILLDKLMIPKSIILN